MAQGGEFAFVLYAAAAGVGIFDARRPRPSLTAIVIISMALTPLALLAPAISCRPEAPSLDGVEAPDGLSGSVLVIGFGRFGQIASQPLLARGIDVSIIDNDVEMIQAAAISASRSITATARGSTCCTPPAPATAERDRWSASTRGTPPTGSSSSCKAEFPLVPLLRPRLRPRPRAGAGRAGVDYQIRETFESALAFGEATLALARR